MPTITNAIFDGQSLRPEHPLDLAPNTRVRITIEFVETSAPSPASFLRTARSLRLDAPPDLATNIDVYLYGERTLSPDCCHRIIGTD